MPEYSPNPVARTIAVVALLAAFVLVAVTIASSGGNSDQDGNGNMERVERTGPTKRGARAVENGVWVVREGDTLVKISEATEIDSDELVERNPGIDPQALIPGQRIALR